MAAEDKPFPPEALDTNRGGRMSDAQLRRARSKAHAMRRNELWLGAFLTGLGVFVVASFGTGRAGVTILLIGLACLAGSVILLHRSIVGAEALVRDLRSPRVQSVDGAILKRTQHISTEHSSYTLYYLTVAGVECQIDRETYQAAPEAGYVRLYYLPRSHHVVNLERLPDRPVPEGTTIHDLTHSFFSGWFHRDTTAQADAAASLVTMGDTLKADFGGPVVPPPAEQRDPHPLDEAIVGTWTSPFFAMTFDRYGAVTTQISGHSKTGRWSVDGNGKLRTNLLGRDVVVDDAWVQGDRLTLDIHGKAMTFRRAPDY